MMKRVKGFAEEHIASEKANKKNPSDENKEEIARTANQLGRTSNETEGLVQNLPTGANIAELMTSLGRITEGNLLGMNEEKLQVRCRVKGNCGRCNLAVKRD